MTGDRTDLQLGVFGATHQAESVIALLTGSSLALRQLGRDGFHDVMSDAAVFARRLLKDIEDMRDANWDARCAEHDAGRTPKANIIQLRERA